MDIIINKHRELYSNFCSNNDFKELEHNYEILRKLYYDKEYAYKDLKIEIKKLLNRVYKRIYDIDYIIYSLESFKYTYKFLTYKIKKFENLKIISTSIIQPQPVIIYPKSYLSSLYDCKALIESKRHLIPYTFKNNRRLLYFLQKLDNYSNLEQRLIGHKTAYTAHIDITIFRDQEAFYLQFEYIINNFFETSKSFFDNFKKKYVGNPEYSNLSYNSYRFILLIIRPNI
jgi:hypothetical protein